MTRVAAFITTIGAPTFAACRAALDGQGCHVEVIANVSPFAAALNEAFSRCRTELLVQVDEDMLLFPGAVQRLVELIDAQPAEVCMAIAPLWDEELEMPIYGVKIYRRSLLEGIPFEHHVLGDIHDRERWAAHGLTTSKAPRTGVACVGRHGTFYTPEQAFARWRGLWQRHRRTGKLAWVEPWLDKLGARYRSSGSRRDMYALAGAIVGATEPLWPLDAGPDAARADAALAELVRRIPVSRKSADVDSLPPA